MLGVQRLRNEVGRRLLTWRGQRPYVRQWDGGPLLVLPGVLDPVGTRVGAWLAGVVAPLARPGESWLDMGTGTGVVGLALAARGARVTAADVDPTCVRNALANARLRDVPLDVVESDHFTALPGRFDAVVYNVPFWPGDPAGSAPFARSFYAGPDFEVVRAFAEQARARAPRVLVALSEAGPRHEEAVAALGPAERLRRDRVGGEHLVLFALG